jgi:hypothetical protein
MAMLATAMIAAMTAYLAADVRRRRPLLEGTFVMHDLSQRAGTAKLTEDA